MKRRKMYRNLSVMLIFVLVFLSVDVTVFAGKYTENVMEIQQKIPENEEENENGESTALETLEKLFETNTFFGNTKEVDKDSQEDTVSDNTETGEEVDKDSQDGSVSDNTGEGENDSISDNNGGEDGSVSDNTGAGGEGNGEFDEEPDWGDIIQQDRELYVTDAKPEGDVSLVPTGMWIAGLKEGYTYTGNAITFDGENEIRLYDGKKRLLLNQDYILSYKNNKKVYEWKEGDKKYKAAKAPSVILKGKGNYSGSITRNFIIHPLDFSVSQNDGSPAFQAEDIVLAYNKKVQKGKTQVTYTNEQGKIVTLKENRDFTYTYLEKDTSVAGKKVTAYKDVRETPYIVTIVGKGNYAGTLEFTQTITEKNLISKVKVAAIPAQEYKNGEAVTPKVTLTYKGEILAEYNEETGQGHYTLEYRNNTAPGVASVVITGKEENGFIGKRIVNFEIGHNLQKAKIKDFKASCTLDDNMLQKEAKLSYTIGKGKDAKVIELTLGKDYELTYRYENKVGKAVAVFTGIEENGWAGTVEKTFKIVPYDLGKDVKNCIKVTDEFGNEYPQAVIYTKGGAAPKPVVTYNGLQLTEGVDYKLGYLNNKKLNDGSNEKKMPVIKIIGIGNFKGIRQKDTFTIAGSDISRMNMVAADKMYSNKKNNFMTAVVITDRNGKKLKAGTDYEKKVEYYYGESVTLNSGESRAAGEPVNKKDIVPKGTLLEVVVKGKGNYYGDGKEPAQLSGFYRMVKADIGKATVKVERQFFTGKEICPDKSQIMITLNGETLSEEDYEIVSYTDNTNPGNAKIVVKGVGDYGGSKTALFTIANKSMYCMIIFNANGAASGSMKDMQIPYGKSYSLMKNVYKKKGYKFAGWNTRADGSGTAVKDMAKNPIVIGKDEIGKNLILYAQWELVTYKITYQLNGGVNAEQNPDTYTIHDLVKLQEASREGYAFTGWYTDSKLTKKVSSFAKGTTGNKTLYAGWRESFVQQVKVPEEYLDVRDYGAIPDDNADDTNQIERAVREAYANAESGGINTVYVPAGTYIITPGDADWDGEPGISLKSNVNLVMDNAAVLKVKGSPYENYCVISIKNEKNITVTGGVLKGERYRHIGSSGEWGHGVALYGSKNVTISNMSIESNWGDGLYLGTQSVRQPDDSQRYVGCENITVKNCDIFDNRRSNISITDADHMTIDHCFLFDAHGTAPQCGICIEPNSNSSGDRICRDITIKDTTIKAYQGKNSPDYMCFMTHHNPYISGYTTSDGIAFINCKITGYVGNYSGNNLSMDSKTVIDGEFDNLR